ncbi:hypothetical protein C8Q76DRAFT_683636 [Earliella scabrosa]|nr:hypothetical protein C8Q76DRAFT_683636 [Earliella scabrosa]
MTTIDQLPPYVWSEADLPPPSYDIQAAEKVVAQLPPEKLADLNRGVAEALSHEKAVPLLLTAAQDAVAATEGIESIFFSLTAKLAQVDSMGLNGNNPPFEPQLAAIRSDYRLVIARSHELAIDIASYGERFEDVIIPYCTSDEFTVEQKINKIKIFINTADRFSLAADNMANQFDGLKARFAALVTSFSGWAKDREEHDKARLEILKAELESLKNKLAKINTAIQALTVSLGITLGITGVVAKLSGPAAPVVMAVGAIIAGIELISVVGLVVGKYYVERDIKTTQKEIDEVAAELETITRTREELEKAGQNDLRTFNDHIGVLALVWRTAYSDAQDIKDWLQKGADKADEPKYLRSAADNAVSCYKSMARYLRAYANGVQPVADSVSKA